MRELANKLAKQLIEEQKLYLRKQKRVNLNECRYCRKMTRVKRRKSSKDMVEKSDTLICANCSFPKYGPPINKKPNKI